LFVETVALVGAGIVNLITALDLARHGYDVAVYDQAPDPRSGADWAAYGRTRGGGDGRPPTAARGAAATAGCSP
jgi:D-amino-acid dehydrogenase